MTGSPSVGSAIARAVRGCDGVLARMASAGRKFGIRLRYPQVAFGRNVMLEAGVLIRSYDGGRIVVGQDTQVRRGAELTAAGGSLSIGARSLVNVGTIIVATDRISIGDDALIAEYVTIRDHDHAYDRDDRTFEAQGRVSAPIVIGTNVWIAAKATVTRGVTIDPNTIIAANAVVTRSAQGARIFAGVPARPLPARSLAGTPNRTDC